ncbi:MAG: hypothetical protein HYZ69_01195 [Candidatus Colwellbacteria bacterium]|nr:hypothetical protein [Candidatus Colwellbacteria bacterium]
MAHRLLKWFILLALILFIVAVVIFLFGNSSFSENQVSLDIEGPSQASVGDEVVYKVKFGNNTKLDLHDLKLKFTYPEESVVIKDGKVAEELSETVVIDEIKNGMSEEKEFRAFLVGDKGNIKNAKAELEFKAGNLRSSFKKSKTISITLVSVPISLTLTAPPTVVSGQLIDYIFDYRNESKASVSDVKFEFDYPDGFEIQDQAPRPSGNNTWSVPLIKNGEAGRITVRGILKGKEGEIKTVSVSLKRGVNGEFVNYQKTSNSSLVANPLLNVEVLANSSKNYSAHLGEELSYTVRYKNSFDQNLVGLNLEVKLEGEMYDLTTLDTKGGFYNSSSNTILWNASTVPDFSALLPNKSGEIKFLIKIKDNFPGESVGTRNFFVKASAKLSTPNTPPGFSGSEVASTGELATKISAQPTFLQVAYYNDAAFGSFGPLPPKTGQETLFTVHWQAVNPGNDMNQVKVTAILPEGVTWKNIVSVGLDQTEPSFDKTTSQVSWNIGVLPRGTGVASPKYEASFQVAIKPSSVGQVPVIIKDGKFSGTDSFTKEQIVLNAPDLTTDDLVDRPGEGTVE